MSRVLQAVDSIHQVGIYCLALVPPNCLPKVQHLLLLLFRSKHGVIDYVKAAVVLILCLKACEILQLFASEYRNNGMMTVKWIQFVLFFVKL